PGPPSPPPNPPQDRDHGSPTPRPHSQSPERQEITAIIYNHRRPPEIDLDTLAQATILPKLQESMEFISLIRNASFLDLIMKHTPDIIKQMRNAPQGLMDLNNPGLCHSISCYLSNEHASQIIYDSIIRSTLSNFPQAEGVEDCLSFKATESFIKKYTGIKYVLHNMCPDSCMEFTGPFEDSDNCPMYSISHWDVVKLQESNA
ncbi:hypothetical protein PAXRUDRAFT_171593, partial [Paxillus rubicundulus Ve08.2h10]